MATELERLVVALEARTKEFQRELAKANGITAKAMRDMQKEVRQAQRTLDGSFAAMGGGFKRLMGVFASLQIGQWAGRALQDMDKLQDAVERLGVSAEFLQGLTFGAEQFGATFDDVTSRLQRFSREVSEAARGNNFLKELFAKNSVSMQGSIEELFARFADLVRNAKSEAEREDLIANVLGKGAGELQAFLARGSEGMRQFMDEAKAAGRVMDGEVVKRGADLAQSYENAINKIWKLWQGFIVSAVDGAQSLADSAAGVLAGWREWLTEVEDLKRAAAAAPQGSLLGKDAPAGSPTALTVGPRRPTVLPRGPGGGGGGGGAGRTGSGGSSLAYSQQIEDLQRKLELATEAQEALNSAMEQMQAQGIDALFDVAFGRTLDWKQQLEQLARTVIPMLIKQLMALQAAQAVTGMAGVQGTQFGRTSGSVAGFASGGRFGPGLMSVGEHGRELIATAKHGTVIPAGVTRQLERPVRQAPAQMKVVVNNYEGREISQRQSTGPSGEQIAEITVGRAIGSGRMDGVLGERYGLRPRRRGVG